MAVIVGVMPAPSEPQRPVANPPTAVDVCRNIQTQDAKTTRERVGVMLEWFGRRQTIALPINSVVGCLIATILLMILSENNVRTPWGERLEAAIHGDPQSP
jgi:hypothetical protein